MKKLINTVRISKPLKQEVEVHCRYDKEWNTYFLSILNSEIMVGEDSRPICEEITICLNTKAERDLLIELMTKATEKVK